MGSNLKMSQKIDPKEVLLYLNELGYINISSQQLKEFIIDLKKIIKYEYRRRKHLASISPLGNYTQNTENYSENYSERIKSPIKSSKPDIFETLHSLTTEAFKAKIVEKRQVHPIALHITQAKKKNLEHNHCVHIEDADNVDDQQMRNKTSGSEKNLPNYKKNTESSLESQKQDEGKTDSSKTEQETASSRTSALRTNSKQSQRSSTRSTNYIKSKTQVLRPSSSSTKSINKCDPVALYHEYQKQWKNIKFPGQDNHLDLRWAIREKLINGPAVEVVKKPSVKKKAFT